MYFAASKENRLHPQVTGKRKREVGLVVPAKYTAFTTELHIARIQKRELKNIAFDEKKFPLLIFSVAFLTLLWHYEIPGTSTAMGVRLLFEGGAY